MMTQWCNDDDAMTTVRWRDGTIAMMRQLDDDEAMLCCATVITSLHHRAIDFIAHALYARKWRQMCIFIRHTNMNKGILDRSLIPEKFIFLVYCKIIKQYFKVNLEKLKSQYFSPANFVFGNWTFFDNGRYDKDITIIDCPISNWKIAPKTFL